MAQQSQCHILPATFKTSCCVKSAELLNSSGSSSFSKKFIQSSPPPAPFPLRGLLLMRRHIFAVTQLRPGLFHFWAPFEFRCKPRWAPKGRTSRLRHQLLSLQSAFSQSVSFSRSHSADWRTKWSILVRFARYKQVVRTNTQSTDCLEQIQASAHLCDITNSGSRSDQQFYQNSANSLSDFKGSKTITSLRLVCTKETSKAQPENQIEWRLILWLD